MVPSRVRLRATRPPTRSVALAAAAAAVLAPAGCLDGGQTASSSRSITIYADTTPVGEVSFRSSVATDPGAPVPRSALVYVNSTTRTLDVGIALVDAAAPPLEGCAPIVVPFADTVFVGVVPRGERVIAAAPFPAAIGVYVTRASSAGTALTNPLAGRWSGSLTEWRAGAPSTRAATAVSQSSGAMLVNAVAGGDSVRLQVRLARPRPLAYTAFPGGCDRTYTADATLARVRFTSDTLDVTAAAIPSGAVANPAALPDSFRLLLGKRQ